MAVLVTGATGFLGSALATRLASREGVTLVGSEDCDLSSAEAVAALRARTGPVDQVVHLAAYVPRSASADAEDRAQAVNVTGTANLLAAYGEGLGSFVLASTGEVYPLTDEDLAMDEGVPPAPRSAYARSKLAAEELAQAFCAERGIPLTILRFTTLYGPGDGIDRAIPNFIKAVRGYEPLQVRGEGDDVRDYLHVDDAARALELAMDRPGLGIVNVGSGEGIAVGDLAELVAAEGEGSVMYNVTVQPVAHFCLDTAKAERELGFVPEIALEDGIRSLLRNR